MSSPANSIPSFGITLTPPTVVRDLSLPFRRDFNTPRQAPSTPLSFKNIPNSRTQAIFFYTDDASNISLSDVDIETQSFSSVDETPPRQLYGKQFADAISRVLLAIKSFGRRITRRY